MKKYIVQIVCFLAVFLTAFVVVKCDKGKESKRLKDNEIELTSEKKCDTINHITQATTLTAKDKVELKQLTTEQEKKAVKKVGATLKRVNNITTLTTTTRVDTVVKIDTVYLKDTIVPVFKFRDEWCDFAGELVGNEVHFDMNIRDSVNIIAHRVPRKILFGLIKFGTKSVRVDVYNSCPYNTIRTAKEIKVIK